MPVGTLFQLDNSTLQRKLMDSQLLTHHISRPMCKKCKIWHSQMLKKFLKDIRMWPELLQFLQ